MCSITTCWSPRNEGPLFPAVRFSTSEAAVHSTVRSAPSCDALLFVVSSRVSMASNSGPSNASGADSISMSAVGGCAIELESGAQSRRPPKAIGGADTCEQ